IGVGLACGPPVLVWWVEGHVSLVGVLAALTAVLMMASTILLLRRDARKRAIACATAAAFVVFASAYTYELPQLQTIWLSPRIAAAIDRAQPCRETVVATHPYVEPSLVFLVGTETRLASSAGEAAEHLLHD